MLDLPTLNSLMIQVYSDLVSSSYLMVIDDLMIELQLDIALHLSSVNHHPSSTTLKITNHCKTSNQVKNS